MVQFSLKCGRALTTDHDENYIFSFKNFIYAQFYMINTFGLILRVVLEVMEHGR